MHKLITLKNGLTLITIDLPRLDSVTTLIAVGAGSRYETRKINGISHFLEHMFFKGSKKYPSHEIISNLIDGIGAVNNAATSKEFTFYWIKSAAKHIELASDILSSMLKEPLFLKDEVEREKGVIIEEQKMYRDMPTRYIWDLYESLQFGDQPLGWNIAGEDKTILNLKSQDFFKFMNSLYSPKNMVLVFAGKLPENIKDLAEQYFLDLPQRDQYKFKAFKDGKQTKPKINIYYKKTDQANLILGVKAYDRYDKKRYAARVLAVILGEGMSSRLFIEIREKRGLAYHVSADYDPYVDSGSFTVFAGLKLEKIEEGLIVIKSELNKIKEYVVKEEELKKAKEIIRGRTAIRSESTNFLAEYFGINFILDKKVETFEETMRKIDAVTPQDIQDVAKELFKSENFNLQIIGPFKNPKSFEKTSNF